MAQSVHKSKKCPQEVSKQERERALKDHVTACKQRIFQPEELGLILIFRCGDLIFLIRAWKSRFWQLWKL